MIRMAVCDDNMLQLELMADIIDEYRNIRNSYEISLDIFSGGMDLLEAVQETGFYDIYILDLIMPEINGMETAAKLREMGDPGKIIFLTASLDYAVASYDVGAFYYMLKPADQGKLFQVLDKACTGLAGPADFTTVRTKEGTLKLKYRDILCITLENRALRFRMKGGRTIDSLVIRAPFKESVRGILEDPRFHLCGVSIVINLDYIESLEKESVVLSDGTVLYVSKAAGANLEKVWQKTKK